MEYLNIIIKAVLTCLTANYIISDVVLKCKFFYYSVMTRPMDQETIAIEKITCYIHSLKRRRHTTPWGVTQGQSGGSESEGKTWTPLLWFLSEI